MSTIELLAPVGHREGLMAAVANGADAIYIGGAAFGARKEAAFNHEELIEAIKFCHLHQVKVYVTVNTTVFDSELDDLTEYINFLYLNDVDAIIVQDIGVANLVKQLYPDFELHFSTQMTLHNTKGVEFAKNFGASRAVIARENTIEDIRAMSEVGIELETFVHGALCFSYSGQCLMSSMIGGRSGNRGACAQTCRLPYELVDLTTQETLDSKMGSYLLSPRDLKTIDQIGELIETGVTSFKIEGRLKKAEYVAAVVKAYRQAIDSYLATKQVKVPTESHEDMEQIFNRGFTKGYLFHESGPDWIGADRPNHRGILIGKVTQVKDKRVVILLTKELDLQDGLRFVGVKDYGYQVQKMFVKGADVKKANPGLVEMECPFPVMVGMEVYKTTSVALAKRLEKTEIGAIPIYGEVSAKVGESFHLTIWDEIGHTVTVSNPEPIERAKTTPLGEERLRKQLCKTGSTPFVFELLTIKLDEQMTMPISVLNQLRRQALDQLEQLRQQHYCRQVSEVEIVKPTPYIGSDEVKLTVSVRQMKQLMAVLEQQEVHEVYYKNLKTFSQAFTFAMEKGRLLTPHLPRVVSDSAMDMIVNKFRELPIPGVLVGDYGVLEALKAESYPVLADFSFNANNVQSLEVLKELGVKRGTLSYEVTKKQIKALMAKAPLPVEAIVYGRAPMMVTKHCPLKLHFQGEAGKCQGHYCMKGSYGVRDRKDKVMPILKTGKCLIEIFNAQRLILIEYLQELKAMGVRNFRLEFTNEEPEEVAQIVQAYVGALKDNTWNQDWLNHYKENQDYTKGHYHRGV